MSKVKNISEPVLSIQKAFEEDRDSFEVDLILHPILPHPNAKGFVVSDKKRGKCFKVIADIHWSKYCGEFQISGYTGSEEWMTKDELELLYHMMDRDWEVRKEERRREKELEKERKIQKARNEWREAYE